MSPAQRVLRSAWSRCALTLLCLALLATAALRTLRIETDFSAFLPPSATPEQRLLVSQLRDGLVSRLMLVALHGADEKTLAAASHALARKLDASTDFAYVANGSMEQFAAQGEVLMRHRYVLSPQVGASRFTVEGLRDALQERLDQLASPFGVVSRETLARDPTGELFATLAQFDTGAQPALRNGVWFSADGQRAFLVAQTRAPGFDSERQGAAMATLQRTLAASHPGVTATLTGPGVFAAESRRVIEGDAETLGWCSIVFIVAMMAFIYRSPLPMALVLLPVGFGLLAGVLVVQATFGAVQAITLGFAATLIGEAVDYPNYLLLNTAAGDTAHTSARRIGRTLTLAVLTTVASATALTLSSFAGLAQLGVLTMVGISVAGFVTRFVLPWLLGERHIAFHQPRLPMFPGLGRLPWPRTVTLLAMFAAAAWLWHAQPWWQRDLASLSPVPERMRDLDTQLRREMGAPEVSFFIASRGRSEAEALGAAESLLASLQQWKQQGLLHHYDSPAWYLPSPATQSARVATLPDTATLERNLREALQGLPFRADAFTPFVRDVAAARNDFATRASYAGTPLGARLDALVLELDGEWLALTSLGGVGNTAALANALAASPNHRSELIDLAGISTRMVENYRVDAMRQAGLGAGLIVLLLAFGLRSLRRTCLVVLPVAAAMVLTVACLVATGTQLSVFHLVALLLVMGIGLNYALFFERPPADAEEAARTRLSLLVCSVSTVATFGFLSSSATPVLHAIGATVALGSVFSLLLAALWARADDAGAANG